MMLRILTILTVAIVVSGQAPRAPGPAQPTPQPGSSQPGTVAIPSPGGPSPYDAELMRLSEILGALQYLRTLCGANEGQKWRQQMQALVDAETPSGERRERLIGSFNRGYRSFQQTYRTCTPSAAIAVRRYLDEGAKISREITARYAN
jgi:uncharacterized protein (TIGR02301 family)